ncbi:MAG TPA: hypothetical protein DC057_03245 [Spirochaetia bacterium]|nr:hypothetical protein [Spirochaetia bacterium]
MKITETTRIFTLTEIFKKDIVGRKNPVEILAGVELVVNFKLKLWKFQNPHNLDVSDNCHEAFKKMYNEGMELGRQILNENVYHES